MRWVWALRRRGEASAALGDGIGNVDEEQSYQSRTSPLYEAARGRQPLKMDNRCVQSDYNEDRAAIRMCWGRIWSLQ
jgi:hypothetical protein